jgi:hypothetical protein
MALSWARTQDIDVFLPDPQSQKIPGMSGRADSHDARDLSQQYALQSRVPPWQQNRCWCCLSLGQQHFQAPIRHYTAY